MHKNGYDELLAKIAKQYEQILHDNLVGIYVHGSIGFGCFHWNSSDIDFIIVVEKPISKDTKLQLLQVLVELIDVTPPKGFEMSVVLRKHCEVFSYPTPYEFHLGVDGRHRYEENLYRVYDDGIKCDYDLAAHFTIIKNVGIVLCGEPIPTVFGDVPKEDYLDSIRGDVENAREDVIEAPLYVILNLCRVYAFIKDGLILSKKAGGEWGLANLSEKYHGLISEMLNNYLAGTTHNRNKPLQVEFSEYMLGLIMDSPTYEKCE